VLDRLIERLGVERVVVSAYGVREGLLLEAMPPEIRDLDPLIEGCEALTAHRGSGPELGHALEAWVSPLFEALPPLFGDRDGVLLAAAVSPGRPGRAPAPRPSRRPGLRAGPARAAGRA
jgi:exopolyphosphatase/guanosine-5'-triphosphate,3'-diphosphate pyrophosphatase